MVNSGLIIYNKCPLDIQEVIDKHLFESHKEENGFINSFELIHRQLRTELYDLQFNLDPKDYCLIDFLCWEVIRTRPFGEWVMLNGYKNSIHNENKLCFWIMSWVGYLQKKNNKPNYEDLNEAVRLAIDNWCFVNILSVYDLKYWCDKLLLNIGEVYDMYLEEIGNIDTDEDYHKTLLCYYLYDWSVDIIMKSYAYEIDDD